MRTLTWFTSVGMKSAPIPARAASTSRNVTAEASPRLWIPCRWKNSTAGFIASARKSEIRIQVTTCLEIQITSSTMATAMIVPSTVRIVRTGKRTSRSGTTRQGLRARRTVRRRVPQECAPSEPARRTDRDDRSPARRPVGAGLDRCAGGFLHREARSRHGGHLAHADRRGPPRGRQHGARSRPGERGPRTRTRDRRGARVRRPRADRGGAGAAGGSATLARRIEPLGPFEAGELLDRAVYGLENSRVVDDHVAGPERQLVHSLPLAGT